jgi:O-antigen/teichoic acid export membrane protein
MNSVFARLRSLVRGKIDHVSSLQGFNLIRFGVTLLIGILLAKSGMPTEDIAIYETLLFLTNLSSFFWIGGGQNALLSFFPKVEGKENQDTLLWSVLVLYLLFATLAGLGLLGASFLMVGRWTSFRWPLLAFVLLYTPSHLTHLVYLLRNRYDAILQYGVISFSIQLLVVLIPVFAGYGVVGAIWGLVAWGGLRAGWLVWVFFGLGSIQIRFNLLRAYWVVLIPLMLHLLIGNSVEYIDGLLVGTFLPPEAFAVFRYGARELPLTTLLVGAVVAGLIPVASQNLSIGMEDIRTRTTRLSHFLFPLSGFFMIISPWLFPLVYNADFLEAAWVFNWYLLILTSRILLPQIVVISQGKNYILVVSAIIETVINVGLSVWWVQIWGLQGIAAASVIAYMVNKVNLILYNQFQLGISWRSYTNVRVYLLYSIFLVLCFGFTYYFWN